MKILSQFLLHHLQDIFHAFLFFLVGDTGQLRTADVTELGYTTGFLDYVGQAFILAGQGVLAGVEDFALDGYIGLFAVARTAAYEYLIVWLEDKSCLAVNHKAVFQGKRVGFSDSLGLGGALRVADTAGYIYAYKGG